MHDFSDLKKAQETLDAYAFAVSAIVAAVGPAVVRIQISKGHHKGSWSKGRARTNHGSGVIVNAEAGHVVTNFHVVRNATHVQVHLHDGTAVQGEVLGADPDADLAVIKVEAKNLNAAAWGGSDALHVGSVVIALGNPDGDQVVATSGIVSNQGRRLRGPSGRLLENLIQTDAIFNPGMSGGPLVNSAGEVVGINTASMVEAQGINLAISSTIAQKLVSDLVAFGAIQRPRLGIAGERQRIYGGLLCHHKLDQSHGVFIHDVRENSPAANAGFAAGDLLITAAGETIEGLDDLHRVLSQKNVGEEMDVRLLRDLDLIEVTVTLAPMDVD